MTRLVAAEEDRLSVARAVNRLVRSGRAFTVDEVWDLVDAAPAAHRAWLGRHIQLLLDDGAIRFVAWRETPRSRPHSRPARVWQGTRAGGAPDRGRDVTRLAREACLRVLIDADGAPMTNDEIARAANVTYQQAATSMKALHARGEADMVNGWAIPYQWAANPAVRAIPTGVSA